jgi:hypothetical protein
MTRRMGLFTNQRSSGPSFILPTHRRQRTTLRIKVFAFAEMPALLPAGLKDSRYFTARWVTAMPLVKLQ